MDGESSREQDARVKKLWRILDTQNHGWLDINGLKKGLQNIDHPLKNADVLIQDVLELVDTNGDGRIEYSEFRNFVEQTEKELWKLFNTIDRDHNGQVDQSELRAAFRNAGLIVSKANLEQFFAEVDTNRDGVISFAEWRNFLLFIPTPQPGLKAVLSYYSSTVTFNPEGDVHISNEAVESSGRNQFLSLFFGVLVAIASSSAPVQSVRPFTSTSQVSSYGETASDDRCHSCQRDFPWDPGETEFQETDMLGFSDGQQRRKKYADGLIPDPGYFIAGAIAGVVSRTATAPLDRLKVYLIAQTSAQQEMMQAVKSGAPTQAVKLATRPLAKAIRALWNMGGFRSFFTGNGLNVFKVMPENAIKFGSYEGSKRVFAKLEGHHDPKALSHWSQFLAGGMGGCISQFCIYPLDTLKFRMQNETTKDGLRGNALILTTARKMWNSAGIHAFYRGLTMGLIGMFPYSAIDLTTFEYLKRFITARNARIYHCHETDPEAVPGNIAKGAIGAFSGAFGATTVYPLNLLRTRLQCQGTAAHPAVYDGMWDVAVKTVKGEGWRGLWKGLTPNLAKVVPAMSITWVVYENSKKVMGLT